MTQTEKVLADAFKDFVWMTWAKAGVVAMIAANPWLGWGPLPSLITAAATYFAGFMYDVGIKFADLTRTPIKNKLLKQTWDRTAVSLQEISDEKGSDSEEFKNARLQHQKDFSKFVRYDVAR